MPPPIRSYKRDVAALLLDYLYRKLDRMTQKETGRARGHAILRSKILRRNVHREACGYLNWLNAAGVLHVIPHVRGKRSNAYAFTDQYRQQPIRFYRCTDWTTYRKARRIGELIARGRFHERVGLSVERVGRALRQTVHCHSARSSGSNDSSAPSSDQISLAPVPSLPLNEVQFCTAVSNDVVAALRADLHTVTLKEGWREFVNGQLVNGHCTLESFNSAVLAAQSIADQRFYCERSPKNGRVHTNVTNLTKSLRRFLILDGCADLTQFDIRSSQPFFLGGLARLAVEDGLDVGLTQNAVDEWQRLVAKRDIYAEIAALLENDGCTPLDRDAGKTAMMLILFSHNNQREKAKEAFAHRFPEMFEFVRRLKLYRHNDCAMTLQRFEAMVVIDRIACRLTAAGVRLLTVHDALIVRSADRETVNNVMVSELSDVVGACPQLHVDHWS